MTWESVQKFLASRPFYNFLACGVIVSLAGGIWLGVEQRRLTNCVAAYSNAQNANTKFRAEAAAEERESLDTMISAIAEAQSVPANMRQAAVADAFQEYLRTRAYLDGKREVSPIPDPPSQTCG